MNKFFPGQLLLHTGELYAMRIIQVVECNEDTYNLKNYGNDQWTWYWNRPYVDENCILIAEEALDLYRVLYE